MDKQNIYNPTGPCILVVGPTGPTTSIQGPTGCTKSDNNGTITDHKSGNFDTLVLSGGSINAIIVLGSLQYAKDNFLISHIKTYVGTSAGAILGYLLAIGYTPIEIIIHLCTNQLLERMKQFNIMAMLNGRGATTFNYMHEHLEKMTIEKIGRLVTLKELYTLFGKTLVCTTYNMTVNKLEILHYETHPDIPCLIALRMSSNLPFIFDHFKYMGNFYIDGGISNNYPVDIADNIGTKILGIILKKNNRSFSENSDNMIEYMYQLISIPIKQSSTRNVQNSSDKCTTIAIVPSDTMFFNFNLDSHAKLEMFSNGYRQMQKQWEQKQWEQKQ